MSNCDWGRPCDCIECRTASKTIICPNCNFENIVEVIMDVTGYSHDKKGIGGYNFSEPIREKKNLSCYNCSFFIKDVEHFDKINEYICNIRKKERESKRNGFFCQVCQKTEEEIFKFGFIKKLYKQANNSYLCHNCLFEKIKENTKDPSDETKKYYLSDQSLKWELSKIRITCNDCQKKRWLLAKNVWKKYCITCYRKRNFSTFANNKLIHEQIISTQNWPINNRVEFRFINFMLPLFKIFAK